MNLCLVKNDFGPSKLFWKSSNCFGQVQIVLFRFKLFWLGSNKFGQFQIILFWTIEGQCINYLYMSHVLHNSKFTYWIGSKIGRIHVLNNNCLSWGCACRTGNSLLGWRCIIWLLLNFAGINKSTYSRI